MIRHPLTDYLDRIEPQQTYTVRDLADITGRARWTVGRWAAGGHLGEGGREETGRGTLRRVWTGRQLLDAVAAPRPVQDHDEKAPQSTWALGCRAVDACDCSTTHTRATTGARRAAQERAFPPPLREQVLKLVQQGSSLAEAATGVGVSLDRIWGYAKTYPTWADALDAALMDGRRTDIRHGTYWAYQEHGCRCGECRAAKSRGRGVRGRPE